ncbi:MAG: TerB family tellurite resistance protein [Acidobacteria bacterium]|nr:TerB family tellurite resistance protein [Acidobacteriota bacterium]
MAVWKMLGFDPAKWSSGETPPKASPAQTETVRKIVHALDSMEPDRARHLAAFAYLLSRVAFADQKISPEETSAMERLVMARGGLPEDQAILVVQMAKTQSLLFSGTENFLVAREFGKITGREDKFALLHCLYAVCGADKSISTVEDNEIRKMSSELHLSHQDFIAVRIQYRNQLAVFQK